MLERAARNLKKLTEFWYSNFKLDWIRVRLFVFLWNSNSMELEILEIFKLKLGKLISKTKLKLKKNNFSWTRYVFKPKVFMLDETRIRGNVCLFKHYKIAILLSMYPCIDKLATLNHKAVTTTVVMPVVQKIKKNVVLHPRQLAAYIII